VSDRYGPSRHFPLVGEFRVRHRHWQCRVYYTETEERSGEKKPRVQVVYLDKDTLVPVTGVSK
jgi:hypothetical protein